MTNQLTTFLKDHIKMVLTVCAVGFILLVLGEIYLYRQQMHLNQMISEGFMQLKESQEMDADSDQMMEGETQETDTMMMEY